MQAAALVVLLPRSMVTAKDWAKFAGVKSFTSSSAHAGYLAALEAAGHTIDRTNPRAPRVLATPAAVAREQARQAVQPPAQGQSGSFLVLPPPNLVSSPLAARIVNLAVYWRGLDNHRVQFEDEMHKKAVLIDLQRFAADYIAAACVDHAALSALSRARATARAERAPRGAQRSAGRGQGGMTCQ